MNAVQQICTREDGRDMKQDLLLTWADEKSKYEFHGFLRELMHGSEKRRMKYPFQVSISMSELAAILRFKGRLAERWTSCDAN